MPGVGQFARDRGLRRNGARPCTWQGRHVLCFVGEKENIVATDKEEHGVRLQSDTGGKTGKPARRVLLALFLLSLALTAAGRAQAAPDNRECEELSLDRAVEIAMAENPGLAAIQARYEALAAVPDQAGSLPDPVLSLAALNLPVDTFDAGQENMTQMQVGISQKLPFPGKLKLREQAASSLAEAAASQVDEARLQLVRQVKNTWWDIYYLEQTLAIVRDNQDLLRATVGAARTKYAVGKGLQQDVLLAQLELSKLLDREIALQNSLEKKKADLNALLDAPASFCISMPAAVATAMPEVEPEQTLLEEAFRTRPALLALAREKDAAASRIELARKDYYPDFTVGAAYGYRQDSPDGRDRADFASVRLSLNLPIWSATKQDRAVAQRTSETLAVEHRLRDTRDKVTAEVLRELSEYESARKQSRFYQHSIIPQAEQTAAAMLKGYQVNKVDFLNVVRAQLALYNYKITYWRLLTGGFKALAGLEAATGIQVQREKSNEK
ncbi:MAG TPA: TolC family protein [Desulfobulbus sp.]|nr:TolC family protein [Desulfobulbus sp.]